MTEKEHEEAKRAKAAWARQYRKEHPDRVKDAQTRYWLKKARQREERDKADKEDPNE